VAINHDALLLNTEQIIKRVISYDTPYQQKKKELSDRGLPSLMLPLPFLGNFAHGHRSMVILANRHRSILNLLMDTALLRLFAGGH
jgi:hypothetical protein